MWGLESEGRNDDAARPALFTFGGDGDSYLVSNLAGMPRTKKNVVVWYILCLLFHPIHQKGQLLPCHQSPLWRFFETNGHRGTILLCLFSSSAAATRHLLKNYPSEWSYSFLAISSLTLTLVNGIMLSLSQVQSCESCFGKTHKLSINNCPLLESVTFRIFLFMTVALMLVMMTCDSYVCVSLSCSCSCS